MPDLDRQLGELRTSLHDTVHQPELDRLIERSRQRTTRRRTQLAAIAAVLVVAVMIPVLRTVLQPAPNHPAGQPTAPPTRPAPDGPFLNTVDFADARHGYAIRSTCVAGWSECSNELLVTSDGAHWESRALPPELVKTHVAAGLHALRPESIVVGTSTDGADPRFYSADAGRTWQPVDTTLSEIATIPDGAILEGTHCDRANECTVATVVTDPSSGRSGRLANQPPVREASPAARHQVAGGWWVWGYDQASGQRVLAVSRDAGRSWSRSVLPNTDATWISVTTDGHALYATAYGGFPDLNREQSGLAAIFRSTDGGASWQQTWQAKDGVEPRAISGELVPTAGGRLLLSTGSRGPMWASTDGGKTFQVAPDVAIAGYFVVTSAGYLAGPTNTESNVYKLSADGVQWKEITVG
jgi:hypothetical protein